MLIDAYSIVNDEFFRVLIARSLIGFYDISSVSIMPLNSCADKPMTNRHRNRCEAQASIKRFPFSPSLYSRVPSDHIHTPLSTTLQI